MKLITQLGPLGLIALAASLSSATFAQDANWYLGANLGQSQAEIDNGRITQDLLSGGFTTTEINADEKDSAYKIFAGYQFNSMLSVEAGYFDLGTFDFTARTDPLGTLSGNIKLRGVNLDLVGLLPLNEEFSLFARAGVHYTLAKDNFAGTGLVNITNSNPSKREANLKLGLGIQYAINEAWAIRLEDERYHVNDGVSNRGDVDLISIGAIYRFGANKEPAYTPMAPSAPAPVVAAPAPAPAPSQFSKTVLAANELFTFDSAQVRAPHAGLYKIADGLNSQGAPKQIVISGYTDRLGSDQYNQKLSQQRAEGVKRYLVSRGIAEERLIPQGRGEADPVVMCNDTLKPDLIQCLAPNRRVEIDAFTVLQTTN